MACARHGAGSERPGRACELAEQIAEVDAAERRLVVGIGQSFFQQAELAAEALLGSFRAFCRDRRRSRAAVSAVFLGRLEYWLHDNPHVGLVTISGKSRVTDVVNLS